MAHLHFIVNYKNLLAYIKHFYLLYKIKKQKKLNHALLDLPPLIIEISVNATRPRSVVDGG